MKKKILYTLQFYLDTAGTPNIQEKWASYNDPEIEGVFDGIQLRYLARQFAEKKKPPHFRKIFDRFIGCLIEDIWEKMKKD